MISTPDRQKAVELIDEARGSGARLRPACRVLGITARTYQRWTADGDVRADRRPEAVRPLPSHALKPEEREAIVAVCNEPAHASMPPGQIVPKLADEGRYMASESSFYRVLREEDQQHHRGRARKPGESRPPATHRADGPNTVWCWDITWLPSDVRGRFFFLYLIMDLFSRKVVGWEVHEQESAVHSSQLVQQTVWKEGCIDQPLVLHGDNGSSIKGQTVQVMLSKLSITPSFSRPRVSDDNAFVESLFRTCKYMPNFPKSALLRWRQRANGFMTSSTGTTASISIAGSTMSRRKSVIPARTLRSSQDAMPSTNPLAIGTPSAGAARPETGHRPERCG